MNLGAKGYIPQGQYIAWLDVSFVACDYRVAYRKILGGNNVAFGAVGIMQKGDTGRSIWVVFYAGHLCRHVYFVTLKINKAVAPFVSAAAVATCYPATGIATTTLLQGLHQTFFWARPC
jgi:hypothetical protein